MGMQRLLQLVIWNNSGPAKVASVGHMELQWACKGCFSWSYGVTVGLQRLLQLSIWSNSGLAKVATNGHME